MTDKAETLIPLDFSTIQRVTGGAWISSPDKLSGCLIGGAFDTRSIGEADIFFAWKGERGDGHDYLDQLTGTSVKLIVVEQDVEAVGEIAILRVSDSLTALREIAGELIRRFSGRIVNITGSSGKTTAKSWLTHLLKSRFQVLSTTGSFNNHIGCPITILGLKPCHEILVLEMGSSGLGELEALSAIAPADIAVVLNVGHAHLGKFGSIENTYLAKVEIFSHLKESAVVMIPQNDKRLLGFVKGLRYVRFGRFSADFSWQRESIDPIKREQRIGLDSPLGSVSVVVNQIGEYVGDLLSALVAICFHLGVSLDEIGAEFGTLPLEKGRSRFKTGISDVLILDDTYNANPESVINMLKTICTLNMDRTVGVIGNMAELEEGLVASSAYIAENIPVGLTHLVLSGDTGGGLYPIIRERCPQLECVFLEEIPDIINYLSELADKDTVMGIKGSRSSHFERVVYGLTGTAVRCQRSHCPKLIMCSACDELLRDNVLKEEGGEL